MTSDFSRNFCHNQHEIKKNQTLIHNIRDFKYPRLLNSDNFATFSTRDFYFIFLAEYTRDF